MWWNKGFFVKNQNIKILWIIQLWFKCSPKIFSSKTELSVKKSKFCRSKFYIKKFKYILSHWIVRRRHLSPPWWLFGLLSMCQWHPVSRPILPNWFTIQQTNKPMRLASKRQMRRMYVQIVQKSSLFCAFSLKLFFLKATWTKQCYSFVKK